LDVRIPDGRQRAAVGKKKSGSDHIFGLLRWDSQGEPFVPGSGDDVRYPDESLPVKIPLLFLHMVGKACNFGARRLFCTDSGSVRAPVFDKIIF